METLVSGGSGDGGVEPAQAHSQLFDPRFHKPSLNPIIVNSGDTGIMFIVWVGDGTGGLGWDSLMVTTVKLPQCSGRTH